MAVPARNPEFKAPNTLYEIAYRKWKQQWDDIDSLERKSFGLFTVASAVLAAALTAIRLRVTDIPPDVRWLIAIGIAFFVAVFVLIGFAIVPRSYQVGPDVNELRAEAHDSEEPAVQGWAADMYLLSFSHNQRKIDWKAAALQVGLFTTGIEVAVLAAAILFTFT